MISRRQFFSKAAVVADAAALGPATRSVQGAEPIRQRSENPENITRDTQTDRQEYPPGEPGKDYTPVITPNGSTLLYKVVGGVKVFHLIRVA
jgi:manganese oxidase